MLQPTLLRVISGRKSYLVVALKKSFFNFPLSNYIKQTNKVHAYFTKIILVINFLQIIDIVTYKKEMFVNTIFIIKIII